MITAVKRPAICKKHKPINKDFGYVGLQMEADRRKKLGMVQWQCKKCLRWFWQDEM